MLGLVRPDNKRPRTALVLGAGGIKTVCHLGLFHAFERAKIPIDLIVGSSGGSLFGAAYALGTDPKILEEWVRLYWTREIFRDYGFRQLLKMLSPARFKFDENFGIIKGEQVRTTIAKLFGDLKFTDTKIPLHIIASDLLGGEAVELTQGSLVDAIRASISMPVFFQPQLVDGRFLVDGALCSPLPIEFAIQQGAEVIICMGFANRPHSKIDSPIRLITQLMKISGTMVYRSTLAYHRQNPKVEIVPIELELDSKLGMRDVEEIPGLIELGEKMTLAQLPLIQETIANYFSTTNRIKRKLRAPVSRLLQSSLDRISAPKGSL